ncbi:efflux RND transporter periplasmic adaptor subunit [Phyllobacterium endophyticum]|nr:efflux RND transporter periplasmic adaptor subunit [Phyllobacterium endophyticum]MBB3237017.1 RND family efflux transporter MFP subunit [Phyllobacterium endophyticum]
MRAKTNSGPKANLLNGSPRLSYKPSRFFTPKKLALLSTVAIAATIGLSLFASSSTSQSPIAPPRKPVVPVVTARASAGSVPHLTGFVGIVQSLQSSLIRPQIDGALTQLVFNEGDLVAKGQLLATIDDRPYRAALESAQAQLARDRAQLKSAESDLGRAKALRQQNTVSQQTVDQQTAVVDQLRATTAIDQANIDMAEVNLSYTRIHSPLNGRVGLRQVDAGNTVRSSDANGLVSVVQVSPISVVFSVPQQILAELRAHSRTGAGADIEAIDREKQTVMARGKIVAFDNQIDSMTGTARVRAVLDNNNEELSPGAFVSVKVQTGNSDNAVAVPKIAVRPGPGGSFVYRVRDKVAERVDVKVGYTNDDIAVISEGISAGDTVVVDGHSRLSAGAQVEATSQNAAADDPLGAKGATGS